METNRQRGFAYAREKLSAARRILMLPHPLGEAHSIMRAFHEIKLAFSGPAFDRGSLDEDATMWVERLENLMNTDGLTAKPGTGLWMVKAERLTDDEKSDLSDAVDDLEYWFSRQSR